MDRKKDCQYMKRCPFFAGKMAAKPATLELYKNHYCHGLFKTCARYMVCETLGKEKVPDDLFPNDKDAALTVLEKGVAELQLDDTE